MWARIAPLMPADPARGRRWADHRRTLEAIAWEYRTCSPWRDLSDELGSFQTARKRLIRWAVDGTRERIPAAVRPRAGKRPDAVRAADDYPFGSVHQVEMPAWHTGRVVLVGDSAWSPTLYSGMAGADPLGTSLQCKAGTGVHLRSVGATLTPKATKGPDGTERGACPDDGLRRGCGQ